MIFASHYVIEDLLHTLEGGDIEEMRKMCEKYCGRYKNDSELIRTCNMIPIDLEEIGDETLKDIKSRLKELSSARRLETSGGTRLWFEDRRRI